MRACILSFMSAILIGTAATALAQNLQDAAYTVAGIALGSRVKFDSDAYRQYKCSASEQFDGFTWCQFSKDEKESTF